MTSHINMIVHDIPQRSPEWFAIRRGLITGSEAGPFLFGTDKKSEAARENLVCKKLGQIFGEEDEDTYQSYAMKRGTELEPLAMERYKEVTGYEVDTVGFCVHESAVQSSTGCYFAGFGCSPDGLIHDPIGYAKGVEIKCPMPSTMAKYLRAQEVPAEYLPQIHQCMVVTSVLSWDFFAFCPGMPYLLLTVEWDETTERYHKALCAMTRRVMDGREEIVAIHREQERRVP